MESYLALKKKKKKEILVSATWDESGKCYVN
jgi:hypothetical protein